MMELTCAFIFTFVSLVSATPYGYGVKGGAGASAIAQSSASAGAFGGRGDIPVTAPFGHGFSESFSKSSSSSSSSSSASSSSSSYSYSSSGAGGFSGPGGCTSGTCQGSGTNEISPNHGNTAGSNGAGVGLQGYNTANAAASAGSNAGSGTGCHGATCGDNDSEKCTSGQCQHKSPTGSSSPGYNSNDKCSSGQCGSGPQTGPSASSPYDDSDDIRFVPHSSKSVHDSKDQTGNKDKTTGYNAGSDCYNGNCGSSKPFDSQPDNVRGSTNTYQSQSNNQHATNSNSGTTSAYHLPSTHLETPKQDSDCSNGNCAPGQYQPGYGSSTSSYNVPIHGSYDSNKQKPVCSDGKCDNQQKGGYSTTSNSLSTNYLNPQDSHSTKAPTSYYPSSTHCTGSNCGSVPSSQISGRPSISSPTSIHPGLPTTSGASSGPASCNSPSCNPQYSAGAPPTGASAQPGHEKLPVYTGGFGAPAGVFKPNEYDVPATGPTGHTSPSLTTHKQPAFGTSGAGCNSPNCQSQAHTPGYNVQPGSYGYKPTADESASGENLPTYTGGFGGPTGMLKPNEFNVPNPVTSKPVHSINPTYNTPLPTTTGCKTGNCFGSSATAQSGSYGGNKQNVAGTETGDNLPTYSGGFGGPAGMLKPGEFDIKVTSKPAHPVNPSYNSHPPSSPTTGCKTGNCNNYGQAAGATAAANAQSGSYGASKPSTGVDSSSELPPYTGGFGGPNGFLKPNEYDVHNPSSHSPTSGISPNKTPTSNYNNAGCTSPNCQPDSVGSTHPHSPYGVTSPTYTTSHVRPIGVTNPTPIAVAPISSTDIYTQPGGVYSPNCKTGACATYPSSGVAAHDNNPTGSHGVTKPNTGTSSPSYGQNGPSGTATSNDHTETKTDHGTSNCKTSNCANIPSTNAGANAQSGSYAGSKQELPTYNNGFGAPAGLLKPDEYSIPATGSNLNDHKKQSGSEPASCSSGNCNPKGTNGAHTSVSSVASANAVAYAGGFGGPPGFLKPYDDGKVDPTKLIGGSDQGSHYGGANAHSPHETKPGSTLNAGTGSQIGSAAGATAYSAASANSGSYGFNAGTHPSGGGVKGSSPCGGGCGSSGGNPSAAVAGARSIASSGAFGTGGSFASSSASAQASAGSYTKGGYGKR